MRLSAFSPILVVKVPLPLSLSLAGEPSAALRRLLFTLIRFGSSDRERACNCLTAIVPGALILQDNCSRKRKKLDLTMNRVPTFPPVWMRFNVVGLFGHFLLFPLNRISAVMLAAIVIAAKTPSSELPSPDYDLALWRPSAGEEYRNRNAL